ncbi:hypothetical protein QBC38DRAFT_479386 [Podospora fimiseda]|uniref:magnesium chelatase n=1 Tax=Podospora fimiseda TaxID=252190 RepID=A0AAN7H1Q4_9PEZI|nr:hypothetical protein QBC38DRAFT_479386 [Podospora fimiseda]
MADERLLDKIQTLGDLELATLLCLVAREHCLIGTLPDSVDELAEELRLIASKTFNLTSAIVSCHAHTTLDEFATGLLVSPTPRTQSSSSPGTNTYTASPYQPRYDHAQSSTIAGVPSSTAGSYFPSSSPSARPGAFSPRITTNAIIPISPSNITSTGGVSNSHSSSQQYHQPQIANVILAKDLDRAPRAVQIQALELLRTRRIFTRTSVQAAPKQFLFIAIVGAPSGGQARVTPHLNDFFYLAHWHDPEEDGFDYLDEELGTNREDGDNIDDDATSTDSSQSVVKRTPSLGGDSQWLSSPLSTSKTPRLQQQQSSPDRLIFTEDDISLLTQLTAETHLSVDVARYQMNIVSFLRMHRAVMGGVSPQATKHFENLAKSLAPLHGLDYVTPSLIALAAKKAYLHRLKVVDSPEKERSVQWGSDIAAVEIMLDGIEPEDIIEDVLGLVTVPT